MLVKDNWIDVSWDGLPRRRNKENLKVVIKKQADCVKPFHTVCDQVANEIAGQYQNLYLAMSGGSDSEHMANVLHRNKIPFKPIIVDYDHCQEDYAVNENWWAKQWCKQHNIKPIIVGSLGYVESTVEKQRFISVKARLPGGIVTAGILSDVISQTDGVLLTGSQLEYYPDQEQMTYLETQLHDYQGFVMEESDLYLSALGTERHPCFFYWSADIMAAFVYEWNTDLTMQENKAAIYGTSLRPKFSYNKKQFLTNYENRITLATSFGSRDCALLGTKQSLLQKLVK